MEINKDLIAASSTPIVLAILSEGDSYGYAILKRVRELSGGRLEWTDGMLYPVLHRLERLGYIEARWEVAETGRRRKRRREHAEQCDQELAHNHPRRAECLRHKTCPVMVLGPGQGKIAAEGGRRLGGHPAVKRPSRSAKVRAALSSSVSPTCC